jgi:hypothetical protein
VAEERKDQATVITRALLLQAVLRWHQVPRGTWVADDFAKGKADLAASEFADFIRCYPPEISQPEERR